MWLDSQVLPDHQFTVFARDDDYFFGALHSSIHELWRRGMGRQLREVESGFRYTLTTTFETFPLPDASEESKEAIVDAARTIDTLRDGWLNPLDVSDTELKKRTLTNLYHLHPSWLDQAHVQLDKAVHVAYGWEYLLDQEEVLGRLLDLNLKRAARQRAL